MGNFYGGDRGDRGGNRGGGFGGGRPGGFQKRSFGNDRGGNRGGDRRDQQMFKTTCAECKKECEVPFRPAGDKPVYCAACFAVRREASDREYHAAGGDRGEKREFAERPPRPEFNTPGGPAHHHPHSTAQINRPNDDLKKQLAEMSSKLDRLVSSMEKLLPKSAVAKTEEKKPEAKIEPKKEVNTASLKSVIDKAVAPAKKVAKVAPKKEVKKVEKKIVAKKADTKKKK